MSDKPISPLRQRMIDDMTARRFSEGTQKDYVRNVRNFTAFLGRSPDTATSDDLRRFQLHMAQQQVSPRYRVEDSQPDRQIDCSSLTGFQTLKRWSPSQVPRAEILCSGRIPRSKTQ